MKDWVANCVEGKGGWVKRLMQVEWFYLCWTFFSVVCPKGEMKFAAPIDASSITLWLDSSG